MRKKKVKEADKGMDAILILGIVFIVFVGLYMLLNSDSFRSKEEESAAKAEVKMRDEKMVVRKPAVAGSFYPAEPEALAGMVDAYLAEAQDIRLPNVRALVAPHAGYVYSGKTAAAGFKQLVGRNIDTVIILAPSHQVRFSGASVLDVTHFETPLGLIKLSPKVKNLLKEDGFSNIPAAHASEHSLEVELPFVQRTLGDFELIPIVVGDADPAVLASVLVDYVDEKTLIVASSDLSHYYPYDEAVKLDSVCTAAIPALDFEAMQDCQACGSIPVKTLMHIASAKGWVGKLVDYRNSGDTAGDKERVVGYASVAFFDGLTPEEEDFLLKLARETLEKHYADGGAPSVDEAKLTARLKALSGAFVTLNKHGSLRGCIGHITPQKPLYEAVIENVLNAALRDPRFSPVVNEELTDIHIDISRLTLPEELVFDGSDELLAKLVPGRDGVVLKYGGRQSTYLPQVWDQLPDKEEFLTSLCRKQGSPGDCWRKKDVVVEVYGAQVFEE
ncbi:MAG: AmmeMemoRadiSam system protein B [Candidatus Altiarchaeota archaeon]